MHALKRTLPAIAVLAAVTTGCDLSIGADSAAPTAVATSTADAANAPATGPNDGDSTGSDSSGTDSPGTDSPGTDSSGTGSTAAGGDAAAPTPALAEATFPAPFAKGATVDVALHGLKRRGQLLDLTFSLTPHAPDGSGAREKLSPYRILGQNSFNVTLIDTVNVKRHVVVEDSEGKTLKPDDVFTTILLDQQGMLTYTFAAPPADVTRMDVHIANWTPFHDVPVE
ncbi:hypothetical protein [Sphaerimonospora mesophila]|uniref:hypothetical protein n=1 Tax=Sphaerimonospora mesophila TaxID=37483 RepID=UPI0006E1ADA0